MIRGVGVDLVSIQRIGDLYEKFPHRFLRRIFNREERKRFIENGSSMASLAAYYAAKEAVLKAIGCGIGPAALSEVEVIALARKQPEVKLHGIALQKAEENKITDISISITHEPPFACAIAAAYSCNR